MRQGENAREREVEKQKERDREEGGLLNEMGNKRDVIETERLGEKERETPREREKETQGDSVAR